MPNGLGETQSGRKRVTTTCHMHRALALQHHSCRAFTNHIIGAKIAALVNMRKALSTLIRQGEMENQQRDCPIIQALLQGPIW